MLAASDFSGAVPTHRYEDANSWICPKKCSRPPISLRIRDIGDVVGARRSYTNRSMHCLSPRVATKKRASWSFAVAPLNSFARSHAATQRVACLTAALRGKAG